MPTSTPKPIQIDAFKYSNGITGIRAIAVIAVIINHFEESLLPFGYLGVDIFFVISGFVITQSLMHKNEPNFKTFFLKFYKRRIKRLFPALIFMVSVTGLLISFFTYKPVIFLKTGLYSIIGVSNIYLYKNTVNYWAQLNAELNPFTHTWSLGVEEQFYMMFPIIFWLILRGAYASVRVQKLIYTLVALTVISLWAYFQFHSYETMMTFYLVPFRFWEIGMGCLLFLIIKNNSIKGVYGMFKYLPIYVLLALILVIFLMPVTKQPIYNVLVSVLTLLLIVKVKIIESQARPSFELRLLTNKVFSYVGTISYSLYLWHWPFIVLAVWTVGLNIWSVLINLVLIFGLSAASYHLVENPLRRAKWRKMPKPKLVLAPMVALIVFWYFWGAKQPNKLFLGNTQNTEAANDAYSYINLGRPAKCKNVSTMGNSHSVHILPMLKEITQPLHINLLVDKKSALPIPNGKGKNLEKLDAFFEPLQAGDLVILSNRNYSLYQVEHLHQNGTYTYSPDDNIKHMDKHLAQWLKEFDLVLEMAKKKGVNLVYLHPGVEFNSYVPNNMDYCLDQWFRPIVPSECYTTVTRAWLNSRYPQAFHRAVRQRIAAHSHLYDFDPMPIYCPGDTCYRYIDGKIIYKDNNHYSDEGSKLMLKAFYQFLVSNRLI